MKRLLLVMGLAMCPVGASAQLGPSDGWGNAEVMAGPGDQGVQPWAAESELSPSAAPSVDWASALGYHFGGFSSGFNSATWVGGGLLCWTGSTNKTALARLHIPHGRKITFFRLWGYDNSSTGDLRANLWQSCLPDIASATTPTMTQLATVVSSGTPGDFTVAQALNPVLVANAHVCTYWAEAVFSECGTSINLQARKVRVEHTK